MHENIIKYFSLVTIDFDPCKNNKCQEGDCVTDDGIKARCECKAG